MEFVRSLADTLLDEAARKATDAATIEFLKGKVERLECALSDARTQLGKEFSHHARYNEQKLETWKYMRELGKSKEEIDAVKASVRAKATPEAKAWYDEAADAEAARIAQEAEHAELHGKKCAELRGTAREECACRFMDEAKTDGIAAFAQVRKRKTERPAQTASDSDDDEADAKKRKGATKANTANTAHDAKKAAAGKKAADAEPHPGTLGIKAPAVSRPKGGKAPAAAKPKAPAATIKKPAAAAKKPAAAAKKPAAAAKPRRPSRRRPSPPRASARRAPPTSAGWER